MAISLKDAKVLVTGGAGFIGSHLVEQLTKQGVAEIIVYGHFCQGIRGNIADVLERDARVKVIELGGDITQPDILDVAMKGVDYVFHLAALSSVVRGLESPQYIHEVNVTGTLNALIASKKGGVKRFVFVSSSSVYGDTLALLQSEGMVPNPVSIYGVSKLAGEHYCNAFRMVYGLSTVCLRFFNVYGKNQDAKSGYATVIPRFLNCIRNGISPVIYGDGEQARDFTYVDDAVEGAILAAESDECGVFNIASGSGYTINELVAFLALELGWDVKPEYHDARVGDIRYSLASIDKARRLLGYNPKYKLPDGLRQMIG